MKGVDFQALRVITSDEGQDFQNDVQPFPASLVFLQMVSKTSLTVQGEGVDFSRTLMYPSAGSKSNLSCNKRKPLR